MKPSAKPTLQHSCYCSKGLNLCFLETSAFHIAVPHVFDLFCNASAKYVKTSSRQKQTTYAKENWHVNSRRQL
jgi:hypothetical protein